MFLLTLARYVGESCSHKSSSSEFQKVRDVSSGREKERESFEASSKSFLRGSRVFAVIHPEDDDEVDEKLGLLKLIGDSNLYFDLDPLSTFLTVDGGVSCARLRG